MNMKGGVGKTTISGNVFREVFRGSKIRTLLIDLDAQFNLTQLLLTRAEYEVLRQNERTIYHVLQPDAPETVFAIADSDLFEVNALDDYTERLRYLSGDEGIELRLLAGDFRLAMLNLFDSPAALRMPRERFRSFIRKARESYGLVVLDCNPSSSFITRLAMEVATHLLVPVRPDKYSLLGVEMITNYMKQIPTIMTIPEVIILLNDLKPGEGPEIVSELRSHTEFGPMVLANPVRHSAILAARADYSGFAVDRKAPYRVEIKRMLSVVANELAEKLGFK